MLRPALVLIVCSLAASKSPATEFGGAVELGIDSFVQRFRLSDFSLAGDIDAPDFSAEASLRDTTEVFSEFRTLLEFALRHEDAENRVDLRTRASFGSERSVGAATLEARMGSHRTPSRLDVAASIESRRFHSGSDFSLQSDAILLDLRAHGSRRLGEDLRAGLRVRVRQEDFESPSIFELNERRLDLSTTVRFARGLASTADLELGAGWRDVADSTQISHLRSFAFAELGRYGSDWSLSLRSGLEHRDYEDPAARSPYWNLILEPTIARRVGDRWRLSLRSAHEFLDYRQDSPIYFDSAVGRAGIELARSSLRWSFSVEPRWSWLTAPSGVDDRYRQPSLVTRFDWSGGGRFWLSLGEEIGHRDYASSVSEFAFYSDYWFFRTTLLASARLRPWLNLDVFLSDEPEAHRSDQDDGRLTLFSASLRASM